AVVLCDSATLREVRPIRVRSGSAFRIVVDGVPAAGPLARSVAPEILLRLLAAQVLRARPPRSHVPAAHARAVAAILALRRGPAVYSSLWSPIPGSSFDRVPR